MLQMYHKNVYQLRVNKPDIGFASAHKQQGNMIVLALFIIVVVGMLAATLISVVSSSSNTTLNQIYALRAKEAADTGIQVLLQASFNIDGSTNDCNTSVNSPSSFSLVKGFLNCSYVATCSSETINFAATQTLVYKYSSTGSCPIDDYMVSRTVSLEAVEEISP